MRIADLTYLFILAGLLGPLSCSVPFESDSLQVIGTEPEDGQNLPANKAIRIRFDRYLAFESLVRSETRLESGEAGAAVDLSYDPVDRTMVVTPRRNMRVGLGYTLTIPPTQIEGLDGTTLKEEVTLSFRAGALVEEHTSVIKFETDILPVFVAYCGCHGPEPKAFPQLDSPSGLVDRPSRRQPSLSLVNPGRPLDSYLIRRLLPNYPGTLGRAKDLPAEHKRDLIRWVNQLAAP